VFVSQQECLQQHQCLVPGKQWARFVQWAHGALLLLFPCQLYRYWALALLVTSLGI
jgi:hypothetical protein